jgi:hypothetical protein
MKEVGCQKITLMSMNLKFRDEPLLILAKEVNFKGKVF